MSKQNKVDISKVKIIDTDDESEQKRKPNKISDTDYVRPELTLTDLLTKKDIMKASSISLACKLQGYPRSCTEISKIFKLKNKYKILFNNNRMINYYNILQQVIKNKLTKLSSINQLYNISFFSFIRNIIFSGIIFNFL